MRNELLAMYKSFDDGTEYPRLFVDFDFDFNGTIPHIYLITVETRRGYSGFWASATFRKNDAGLVRVEVHNAHWPEDALKKLLIHLKTNYAKKVEVFAIHTCSGIKFAGVLETGVLFISFSNGAGDVDRLLRASFDRVRIASGISSYDMALEEVANIFGNYISVR